MAVDVVLKDELLVPFEDADVEIETVDVRETDTDLECVGEPDPVRDVVIVAVDVLDVVCVLVNLAESVVVADEVVDRLVEALRVLVRVLDIVALVVEEPD